MSAGWAIVDGGDRVPLDQACLPITDPGVIQGWTVFETFVAWDEPPDTFAMHLDRLRNSCEQACIAPVADEVLAAEVRTVARALTGPARVRITLTGGGHRVVHAAPLDTSRRHQPIRAVRGVHRDEPYMGGAVKHGSRGPWQVALCRSGADEVLFVDADGRFTEGTGSAILAVVDGVLWTAPHDGRILPSTTVTDLMARAERLGLEVRRRGPSARGPWDGLYIASVTRDLAPVVQLDGVVLPGWDLVGRKLADLR